MTTPLRPELIIEGRIATLAGDSGFGWAEALAIGRGRVMAAGSAVDIVPLKVSRTAHWRLPDDMAVMPGITDAHLHLLTLAITDEHLLLAGASPLDHLLERLQSAHLARLQAGDVDGWLLGQGWTLHGLGRWPDADLLERVAPGRPIALYAHDHHSRWLSRRALRLAGIDRLTADSVGGLVRRDERGEPTGILHEAACTLVDRAIPELTETELAAALYRIAAQLAQLGVTGCHDPGDLGDRRDVERGPLFYRSLAARGRLPLRVHASVRAPQLSAAIEAGLRSGEGIGRYRMGWLKVFADGSLGSRSAALLEPYSDAADNPPTGGPAGMYLSEPDELRELLRSAAEHGISGQVHAIGDGAVRLALDLLAELPATPLARRIEHAQLVHPADVARFGRLGIAASVQPVHLRSDAAQARLAWGARSEHAFPLAALSAAGALIPFGTDAPVEPADPWPGIAVAVTRRDPLHPHNSPLGAKHALDLTRAVRAACLDPAQVAGQHELGRLTAGCRADMIVIPSAVLAEHSEPALLAGTRPLLTMLDGEVIFRQAGFES